MAEQNPAAPPVPLTASEKESNSSSVNSASSRSDSRISGAVTIRNKRNVRRYLIGGSLVLLVAGLLLWRYFSSYESTDDAQVDVHLYPVSPRISGYVTRVNVNDNQYVQAGTVLVEIDPKDYEVAAARARADLANAEATAKSLKIAVPITSVNTSSQLRFAASDVENAKAGIVGAEKQLAAAHAQVEQAEANDVKAQDDLHRYKLLVDKREVAEQVYDQALAAAKGRPAGGRAASTQPVGGVGSKSQVGRDRAAASVVNPSAGSGGPGRRRSKAS